MLGMVDDEGDGRWISCATACRPEMAVHLRGKSTKSGLPDVATHDLRIAQVERSSSSTHTQHHPRSHRTPAVVCSPTRPTVARFQTLPLRSSGGCTFCRSEISAWSRELRRDHPVCAARYRERAAVATHPHHEVFGLGAGRDVCRHRSRCRRPAHAGVQVSTPAKAPAGRSWSMLSKPCLA